MTIWLHTTVLATTLAATVTIAVAGASFLSNADVDAVGKKADRMAMAYTSCNVADLSGRISCSGNSGRFLTVETRAEGENLSVLTRLPAN